VIPRQAEQVFPFSRLVLGEYPAQGGFILASDAIPQGGGIPQRANLAVPGLDRFRWEVTGAGDLAGCRQETVQAGQLYHLIVGARGQNPVQARLLGAGVPGRNAVIGESRDEPIGGGNLALGGFPFAAVQAEAAEGDPGFEGLGASLHKK
jgi:hypothetical protein